MASRELQDAMREDQQLRAAAARIAQAFASANPDPVLLEQLAKRGASNEAVVKALGIEDPELDEALRIVKQRADELSRRFPGAFPPWLDFPNPTDD